MMIFIYERSSHKNAQFAYQEGKSREKINNVLHGVLYLLLGSMWDVLKHIFYDG
jgi:hypothetical protein